MLDFKKKKYLKRIDFINLVDSDKIWSESLTIPEINELLEYLESEISKYEFDIDKNFIMNDRRNCLKIMIEEQFKRNDYNINKLICESLFYFWEFVADEYSGNVICCSELGISIKEFVTMDNAYRTKGIICLQEKDAILEMIQTIKNYINEMM